MKKIFSLMAMFFCVAQSFAQNKEKVTYEQIKQQCASLPTEKRARVSVTRFTVTTSSINDGRGQQTVNTSNALKALSIINGGGGAAPKADAVPVTLGDNLSTMLTNALQGVSCFRVLETLKNNTDLTGEIDAGSSKYSGTKTPKAGKQLGAQIVATGEVVEYSVKSKGLNIMGVDASKKVVKIGFNLKLINPETRDIITSKVIRVQSKASGSVSVLGMVSTDNSDPAVAAVMEDGVIQAVEFMAHVRDSLNITVDNIPGTTSKSTNGISETEISLYNANFASFNAVAAIISSLPGYKSMEKSLSAGVGSFTLTHSGSADDLLTLLNSKLGTKYEVTGFSAGKIDMKVR